MCRKDAPDSRKLVVFCSGDVDTGGEVWYRATAFLVVRTETAVLSGRWAKRARTEESAGPR